MAGCLRAPAARKASAQRWDSPRGGPPRPLPGEGRSPSLGGDGVRGARAGAGGRVSVGGGGRPRAAPGFFLTWWFWTCFGGRGRGARARYGELQGVGAVCIGGYSGICAEGIGVTVGYALYLQWVYATDIGVVIGVVIGGSRRGLQWVACYGYSG